MNFGLNQYAINNSHKNFFPINRSSIIKTTNNLWSIACQYFPSNFFTNQSSIASLLLTIDLQSLLYWSLTDLNWTCLHYNLRQSWACLWIYWSQLADKSIPYFKGPRVKRRKPTKPTPVAALESFLGHRFISFQIKLFSVCVVRVQMVSCII